MDFTENNSFEYAKFQQIVNSKNAKQASQSHMDDPVNNNFVENLMFPEKEYLILTGISQSGGFNLQNLIGSIYSNSRRIMRSFKEKIQGIELILTISDDIIKSCNIGRNTESVNRNSNDIYFPPLNEFENYRDNVIIKNHDLDQFFSTTNSNQKDFSKFITMSKEYLKEKNSEFLFNHPILVKPFIRENGKYIYVLPSSIIDTIRHHILSKMTKIKIRKKKTNEKFLFRSFLFNVYLKYCRSRLTSFFRLLKSRKIKHKLPVLKEKLPILEEFFEYDRDNKLIYAVMIFDNFKKYNTKNPFDNKIDLVTLNERISKRVKQIESTLLNKNQDVMVSILIAPMGRTLIAGLDNYNPNILYWILSLEEISVISRMRKFDIFDIHRFLIWEKELYSKTKVRSFSFLDKFSVYFHNNYSLNITDTTLPTMITFGINDGYDLRRMCKKINDIHYSQLGLKNIRVTRREDDEEGIIPIYVRDYEDGNIFPFLKLVEGYEYPFWIDIGETNKENIDQAEWLFYEFSEMFAYWIWQFQEVLDEIIQNNEFTEVHLNFRFENIKSWLYYSEDNTMDPKNLIVSINLEDQLLWIRIIIPLYFKQLFMKADNTAERKIMSELLSYISKYFISKYNYQEKFEEIIPSGQKKKTHFFEQNEILLQKQNLATFYQIREGDIEYYLQNLTKKIGRKTKTTIEIISQDKKAKILRSIVDYYYKLLQERIGKFDNETLLTFLVAQYDTNINKTAIMNKMLPSQVECYFGIQNMVKELKERNSTDVNTSISIRILIEILSAQPSKGNQIVTITEYFELLAICYHIINWGIISDYNYLGVLNSVISLLPSGRIGVSKEREKRYDSFLSAMFTEKVSYSLNPKSVTLDYDYLIDKFNDFDTEYDKVFNAEFGVKRKRFAEFIGFLYELAKDETNSVKIIEKSELIKLCTSKLNFKPGVLNNLIEEVKLFSRNSYEKPPDGFDVKDIWPWIYNRRLSYIRRPLIEYEIKGIKYLIFGARNTYSSLEQLNRLIISTRYKTTHSSDEMKKFIGKIVDIKGGYFENLVYEWVEENYPNNENLKNEPIGPSRTFEAATDLGDIDVLSININENIVYSLECKNINMGRNPREVSNELERFIGKNGNKNSWIEKHAKRENWLKSNSDIFITEFNLKEDPKIVSGIITSEEIPSVFLENFKFKCISYSRLQSEKLTFLNNYSAKSQ